VGGRGFHACNRLLDVHKSSITACVLLQQPSKPLRHIRRFGYTTGDLHQLVAWLREVGVEYVAMESTGVYWKAVWNILEIIFKSCWRMHSTLRHLRNARQIPRTVSGSPNSCNMDSCAPAIYLQTRIVAAVIDRATGLDQVATVQMDVTRFAKRQWGLPLPPRWRDGIRTSLRFRWEPKGQSRLTSRRC
jgi:hypothetical protein